jgi:hypothetical protein
VSNFKASEEFPDDRGRVCPGGGESMADLAYVVLAIAGFAVLALIARGLESL